MLDVYFTVRDYLEVYRLVLNKMEWFSYTGGVWHACNKMLNVKDSS